MGKAAFGHMQSWACFFSVGLTTVEAKARCGSFISFFFFASRVKTSCVSIYTFRPVFPRSVISSAASQFVVKSSLRVCTEP